MVFALVLGSTNSFVPRFAKVALLLLKLSLVYSCCLFVELLFCEINGFCLVGHRKARFRMNFPFLKDSEFVRATDEKEIPMRHSRLGRTLSQYVLKTKGMQLQPPYSCAGALFLVANATLRQIICIICYAGALFRNTTTGRGRNSAIPSRDRRWIDGQSVGRRSLVVHIEY